MKNKENTASTTQANECSLTQAQFHALVHGFETVMKFNPQKVYLKDSKLAVALIFDDKPGPPYVRALIQADYTSLLGQKVTIAFAADKAVIKKAKAIRGAGDIRVRLQDGQYCIQGDHTATHFPAIPMLEASCFTLPTCTWLGVEVAGYDPKDISAYIGKVGKKGKAVHLAVYDDQLEQVWAEGQNAPYTFTAGMAERLAKRRPDVELLSQVAFRFIGPNQSLRIGKVNDQYFLCATTPIDMSVDLVVTERLDVVSGR